MIYTTLSQLERYLGLNKNLDSVIRYARTCDLSQLHLGRNEIDGHDSYVNVLSYETVPPEEAIWEGHNVYGDMHIMVHGHEIIGVTNVTELTMTVQKEEEDFIGFEGPVRLWAPMAEDSVLIVFPEDAHMVKVVQEKVSNVRKAVFKFKV